MKRWHLPIKDNETGEVVADLDTTVILGTYSTDDGVDSLQVTSDTANVIGQALYEIERLLRHGVKELPPSVLLSYMIYSKLGDKEETVEC